LLVYENALVNKMTNAEHEIERLQRLRRGEDVAPPSARVG
jgi:hypothetical protein